MTVSDPMVEVHRGRSTNGIRIESFDPDVMVPTVNSREVPGRDKVSGGE